MAAPGQGCVGRGHASDWLTRRSRTQRSLRGAAPEGGSLLLVAVSGQTDAVAAVCVCVDVGPLRSGACADSGSMWSRGVVCLAMFITNVYLDFRLPNGRFRER